MIAAWMLSAVFVGVLVTAGAMAADRVLVALRRQTRFVWLAAMGLTLAWPAIAYTRSRLSEGSEARAPLSGSVQQLTAIVIRASERSLHMRADVVLLVAWSLLSVILLARMSLAVRAMRARGRTWRAKHVDGMLIRLSHDVGPAVVGLDPMEVVLPEWALDLEPPLRALVLAHEEEHRRARDPHLLLLSAALIVLVPWNPALWLQSRRLRLAIELDCDARVLRSHPRPERYGLLLLAIAQRQTTGMSLLAPALSERTSNLERRINAMNSPMKNESRVRLAVLGGIAVAAVAVACAVDAPVTPNAAHAPGTVTAASEAMQPKVADRTGDSTGRWAISRPTPDGRGTMTAWVTGSKGRLLFDSLIVDRNGEKARTSREVPVVEPGVVTTKRDTGAHFVRGAAPTNVSGTGAYYEFQVEKTAKWIAGTGSPRYPEALKAAGVEGEVLATFVIDSLGRVDVSSFRALRATNSQFTDAVLAGLPNMRFAPAEVGGHSVNQHVQQSFQFSVK